MKKIFIILAVFGLFTAGCSEWLDVNTDPNVPTKVGTDLILPAAEASLAVRLGGNLLNVSGFWAQYWAQAPEANQYNTQETYDMRTDFLDLDYREHFAGCLNDLERIRTDASEVENWGDYLAATVLRAYTFQIWVDMLDRIPFSEALKGTEFVNPAWEDGQSVYASLISEIDEALDHITGESTVAVSDMVFGRVDGVDVMDEWVGFANAMKLKLYMRERSVVDVSAQVTALLTANNFMTVDAAFSGFQNELNKRNPWYETTQQLNTDRNHVATVNIIRFLNSKSDPRMQVMFDPAEETGTYEGIYPAEKQIQAGLLTTDFSRPNISPTQPVYFYTMAELDLFIAEAQLVFNSNPAAAKTAYDNAVNASLALHGLSADLTSDNTKPYFFDVTKTTDELFEQIMMQKWVSLCEVNHIEAWTEIRRTKIPRYWGDYDAFIADPTAYVAGQFLNPAENLLPAGYYIANRLPYPDIAVTRNTNTPALTGSASFTDKIWWDVN